MENPAMTTIYLLRHGGVENPDRLLYGSLPGFPLSERGRTQIRNVAEEMRKTGVRPDAIIASPLLRTQETAQIVASVFGVADVRTDPRLSEWQMGSWEGKPLRDFYSDSGYYAEPRILPGPETLEAVAERTIAAIEDAKKAFAGKTIIIVSHRENLVTALLTLQGAGFDAVHDLDFPVASVWEIVYTDGDVKPSVRKAFDHHRDT